MSETIPAKKLTSGISPAPAPVLASGTNGSVDGEKKSRSKFNIFAKVLMIRCLVTQNIATMNGVARIHHITASIVLLLTDEPSDMTLQKQDEHRKLSHQGHWPSMQVVDANQALRLTDNMNTLRKGVVVKPAEEVDDGELSGEVRAGGTAFDAQHQLDQKVLEYFDQYTPEVRRSVETPARGKERVKRRSSQRADAFMKMKAFFAENAAKKATVKEAKEGRGHASDLFHAQMLKRIGDSVADIAQSMRNVMDAIAAYQKVQMNGIKAVTLFLWPLR